MYNTYKSLPEEAAPSPLPEEIPVDCNCSVILSASFAFNSIRYKRKKSNQIIPQKKIQIETILNRRELGFLDPTFKKIRVEVRGVLDQPWLTLFEIGSEFAVLGG